MTANKSKSLMCYGILQRRPRKRHTWYVHNICAKQSFFFAATLSRFRRAKLLFSISSCAFCDEKREGGPFGTLRISARLIRYDGPQWAVFGDLPGFHAGTTSQCPPATARKQQIAEWGPCINCRLLQSINCRKQKEPTSPLQGSQHLVWYCVHACNAWSRL